MSYTVTVVEPVTSVTVTEQTVNVATSEQVVTVFASTNGAQGATGAGVPVAGTTGQILAKNSATDYDTVWIDNYTELLTVTVKNSSGSTMTKGAAVYVSGANGTNILISLGQANAEATSSKTLGLINATTINNGFVSVIVQGLLGGLDTSAATIGDSVWLSPTVAGGLVYGLANKPSAPNHMVFIGNVTRAHATQGEIFVRCQNGFELEELHNVAISSPTTGQTILYDSSTSLWSNKPTPIQAVFTKQDTLSAYTGTARYYLDVARTITLLRASVGTAPTGSNIVVTVYKNGVSVGSVTIPAGSYTATTNVNVSASANDYLTVSIISVGSTIAGSDLTVTVTA